MFYRGVISLLVGFDIMMMMNLPFLSYDKDYEVY